MNTGTIQPVNCNCQRFHQTRVANIQSGRQLYKPGGGNTYIFRHTAINMYPHQRKTRFTMNQVALIAEAAMTTTPQGFDSYCPPVCGKAGELVPDNMITKGVPP
jgi:hypothetical protein